MRESLQRTDQQKKKFRCLHCQKRFFKLKNLKKHKRNAHQSETSNKLNELKMIGKRKIKDISGNNPTELIKQSKPLMVD